MKAASAAQISLRAGPAMPALLALTVLLLVLARPDSASAEEPSSRVEANVHVVDQTIRFGVVVHESTESSHFVWTSNSEPRETRDGFSLDATITSFTDWVDRDLEAESIECLPPPWEIHRYYRGERQWVNRHVATQLELTQQPDSGAYLSLGTPPVETTQTQYYKCPSSTKTFPSSWGPYSPFFSSTGFNENGEFGVIPIAGRRLRGSKSASCEPYEPPSADVWLKRTCTVTVEWDLPNPWHVDDFRPLLRFDSSELWRPLNVPPFVAEGHDVCLREDHSDCQQVLSEEELARTGGNRFLDIDRKESINPSCREGGLNDCDAGPFSRIYVQEHETPGYRFSDYWFFYRYNRGPLGLGNHQGDWEGVLVAVPRAAPDRLDWVGFAQHHGVHRYVAELLSCNGGGPGSCGPGRGRVDVFVAEGSHASYPEPCSKVHPSSCVQTGGSFPLPENGHDGRRPWGNNDDPAAVDRLPGSGTWATWPGSWGKPVYDTPWWSPDIPAAGVESPGIRPRWDGPFTSRRKSSQPVRSAAATDACAGWFGASIVLTACNPAELEPALAAGALHGPGTFKVRAPGARAASVPGLAQAMGPPLEPGQSATITGPVAPGTRLYVRARNGTTFVEARFDGVVLAAGEEAQVNADTRAGEPEPTEPELTLTTPDARIEPADVHAVDLTPAKAPAKLRAVRRGSRVVLRFRPGARLTGISFHKTKKGRALGKRRVVRARPGRTKTVTLLLPRGARYLAAFSTVQGRPPSRTVITRIRSR